MCNNTTASDVLKYFESSFMDKHVLPRQLEIVWLEKAIGRFSTELDPLVYDSEIEEFDCKLDSYVVDTLAQMMKKFYQERELSKVNKRISIVGKDLSLDASGNSKKYTKEELDYVNTEVIEMVENQKPSAYI